eukprot:86923-Hanusia_phi.AAC.1
MSPTGRPAGPPEGLGTGDRAACVGRTRPYGPGRGGCPGQGAAGLPNHFRVQRLPGRARSRSRCHGHRVTVSLHGGPIAAAGTCQASDSDGAGTVPAIRDWLRLKHRHTVRVTHCRLSSEARPHGVGARGGGAASSPACGESDHRAPRRGAPGPSGPY